MINKKLIDTITKEAMDKGLIIEAGWQGFEHVVVSKEAPEGQRSDMKMAFFAGAQHLFASIMGAGLDPGSDEPTDGDLVRMDNINKELKRFADEFFLKYGGR